MPSIHEPNPNLEISKLQLKAIRALKDFDLIMLISEVHDHGWDVAEKTLAMMPKAKEILAGDKA